METMINVTVLNGYIHNIFLAEDMLRNINVCGEISDFKVVKGNAYFTLKDANAQISCNCFSCAKTFLPKDGDSVVLNGSVDFYAKGGKLNFNAQTIRPLGLGSLAAQFELLKQKLLSEGIFDESHKVAIPKFCNRVCVITSRTGAVIRDIVTTIRRVNDIINISIFNVKVQGADAVGEIISAIKLVDDMNFDAIIIARGGGSIEDLLPFNDEKLVRAVYNCKTPIISAVGHETDFTLCDLVADVRSATPTAAGQLIGYDKSAIIGYVLNKQKTMLVKIEHEININQRQLVSIKYKLKQLIELFYSKNIAKVEQYSLKLKNQAEKIIDFKRLSIIKSLAKLDANNPALIMKKGFFNIIKNNKTVYKVGEFKIDDEVLLRGVDGEANAKITKVELKK